MGALQDEGATAEPTISAAGDEVVVYRDSQLVVTRTMRPDGIRFRGEIDIANSSALSGVLVETFDGTPNPHLDLTALDFCDVSGIRAIVDVAEVIGPERRLLLHGLAPELERVLTVVGWADQPGFTFCACKELQP